MLVGTDCGKEVACNKNETTGTKFREIPYGPVNSTPENWDESWVKPSEIQNLSTEIGRS